MTERALEPWPDAPDPISQRAPESAPNAAPAPRPINGPNILLGLGLGGFVDGIVLHQVLQWHHLLSSAGYPPETLANLRLNTLADGIFHAATWVLTAAGLGWLWVALRRPDRSWSGRGLAGGLLLGWGIFNLLEGVIDHLALGIHHVNETVPRDQWLLWDLGFLGLGAALAIGGGWLVRRAARDSGRRSDPPPESA